MRSIVWQESNGSRSIFALVSFYDDGREKGGNEDSGMRVEE
jgi:hypothetical protein